MGPTGYRRLCAPLSVGLYEWRMQWIERLLKPTDAQKPPLNDLLAASTAYCKPREAQARMRRIKYELMKTSSNANDPLGD